MFCFYQNFLDGLLMSGKILLPVIALSFSSISFYSWENHHYFLIFCIRRSILSWYVVNIPQFQLKSSSYHWDKHFVLKVSSNPRNLLQMAGDLAWTRVDLLYFQNIQFVKLPVVFPLTESTNFHKFIITLPQASLSSFFVIEKYFQTRNEKSEHIFWK